MARKRKKRKLSPARQEYLKQRKRLSSMVSRLRRKGYDISLSDIAGAIPQRVTTAAVRRLASIRTSERALEEATRNKRKKKTPSGGIIITVNDLNRIKRSNFISQFSSYHPQVQEAIHKWVDYIETNYGLDELIAAIDEADYENITLSDYGGYLIPPEDLSLYLHQLTHFVMSGVDSPPLSSILAEIELILNQYEEYASSADIADFGSWRAKKMKKWKKSGRSM